MLNHEQLKNQIIERVQVEKDIDLLDFVLKLLLSEGGH